MGKVSEDTKKFLLHLEPFDTTMYRENSIPNVQKFTYVKKLLTLDSAAKIKGFQFTDRSYEEALRLPKHIYGNSQVPMDTSSSIRHRFDVEIPRGKFVEITSILKGESTWKL